MTQDELRRRIRLGEDSFTEFKREEAHHDDLAAALVSFANGGGGVLLVGVADDRSIAGVADPDAATTRLDNICRQNVEPPLTHVTVERHSLEGRSVLLLNVPKGPRRPYRTNKGVHFIRGMAGRRIATSQELLELYQSAGSLSPDELAVEDGELADLDEEYLLEVRPEWRDLSKEERLRAMLGTRMLSDDEHPTIGGLLCFGKAPEKRRPYARVTAIRQEGTEVSEKFLDRLEIGGPAHRQIAQAREFLRRHVTRRKESLYELPFQAFDEAVINAVAHRDYLANAQVRLFVFDDRIEIISPGRLLNSVTVDLMRDGFHRVRNPVVFSHLARIGLATDAGRGVPNMIRLSRGAGLPEPELVLAGAELRVTFRLPR